MLTKRSSLMNFPIQKEPRVLFPHVKVICTRKNRHHLQTNPSTLEKQKRKFAFMGFLAIDVFTCDKLLLPNVKTRLRLVRCRSNSYIITKQNKDVGFSKRLSLHKL